MVVTEVTTVDGTLVAVAVAVVVAVAVSDTTIVIDQGIAVTGAVGMVV